MGACIYIGIYFKQIYLTPAIGILIMWVSNLWKASDGVFNINYDDPEKDVYLLEIFIPFGELDRRNRLFFQIKKQ